MLAVDDAAWDACLTGAPHDFYHHPGYLRLEADRLGGRPVAVLVEDGDGWLLLPLVLRPFSLPGEAGVAGVDATSPYGYPAPLVRPGVSDEAFEAAALAEALRGLSCLGVASVFVRLHPLLDRPGLGALRATGALVEHGPTVWIDLADDEAAIRSQTRGSDRNRISKLYRTGFTARMDPAWDRFEDFLDIYRETMDHVEADRTYYFDREYFQGLRGVLGHSLHLCAVEHEGRAVAAGLFSECGGVVQFHLSGTRASYRQASPARLMIDCVRWWAKGRGNRAFHLGGGVGAREDALYEFKAGFSKRRGVFRTWRAIPDPSAYRSLLDRWTAASGRAVETDLQGFFPQYRAPA